MKRWLVALALIGFLSTGCTLQQITLVEAIIAATEGLLPVIAGMSSGQASEWTTYTEGVLAVANDVLVDPQNPAVLVQATKDFQALIVPDIADPKAQALANAVAQAISRFLVMYKPAASSPNTFVASSSTGSPPLSKTDAAQVQALQIRIQAAQTKLNEGGNR